MVVNIRHIAVFEGLKIVAHARNSLKVVKTGRAYTMHTKLNMRTA